MTNKSSPHGSFIVEGTVIHGTLRSQDLLRAFADEYKRVLPFNSFNMTYEAYACADDCDIDPEGELAQHDHDIIEGLINALDTIASREGFYFGAHPGDGSDFGYWSVEED
jgi:hypothetical protein